MTITQDGSKSLVSGGTMAHGALAAVVVVVVVVLVLCQFWSAFGTMAHRALAAETGEQGSAGTLGPDVAA